MTSRLYRSTRPLYRLVERTIGELGIRTMGTPTMAVLIAMYVTGLILLDARPTQTRVARMLPGRCHDALNRLLRTMPFSTRALMGSLIGWVRRRGQSGHLVLDDVIIEKAYARRLPWAGWTYAWSKKRKVYGMHMVMLMWCSDDGQWRIPVAFRLWRPKRSCAPHDYRTRLQLADAMIVDVIAAGVPADYLLFDTFYTAGWLTKKLRRLGCRELPRRKRGSHRKWHNPTTGDSGQETL